jgi:hypothetical protein
LLANPQLLRMTIDPSPSLMCLIYKTLNPADNLI